MKSKISNRFLISFLQDLIIVGILFSLGISRAEAITLGVPAFSQNNNTWSGNQLGTCSELTIGSDGCALTSNFERSFLKWRYFLACPKNSGVKYGL